MARKCLAASAKEARSQRSGTAAGTPGAGTRVLKILARSKWIRERQRDGAARQRGSEKGKRKRLFHVFLFRARCEFIPGADTSESIDGREDGRTRAPSPRLSVYIYVGIRVHCALCEQLSRLSFFRPSWRCIAFSFFPVAFPISVRQRVDELCVQLARDFFAISFVSFCCFFSFSSFFSNRLCAKMLRWVNVVSTLFHCIAIEQGHKCICNFFFAICSDRNRNKRLKINLSFLTLNNKKYLKSKT